MESMKVIAIRSNMVETSARENTTKIKGKNQQLFANHLS
jgi:hypothetical protein